MPGVFPSRRYSDQQRQAIKAAILDDLPVPEIVKRAERGTLTLDGQQLQPFSLNPSSAYDIAKRHRLRHEKRARDLVAIGDPRDTVETLRRRLILIIDAEMMRAEDTRKPVDIDRTRQLAALVREVARIPGPSNEKPVSDPSRNTKAGAFGDTESALAQSLLRTGRPITPANGASTTEPDNVEPTRTHSGEPGTVAPAISGLVGTIAHIERT